MVLKYKATLLWAGVFLVLAAAASALSVGVESQEIRVSSREATLYVWATNPFNEEVVLTFSTDLGILQGSFDRPSVGVAPGATEGTRLRINAPDCVRGVQDVKITARMQGSSYSDSGAAYVRVNAVPAEACDVYLEGVPSSEARFFGAVARSTYYDPSEYSLRIEVGKLEYSVGKASKAEITFMNRGAAGVFDVRLVGDYSKIYASVYPETLSLQRSEVAVVELYAAPREVGVTKVTLQVLKGSVIVVERELFLHAVAPKVESVNATVSGTRGIIDQGVVRILAKVKNPFNVTITNVTAEIIGLPAGWSYDIDAPSEIPANGEVEVASEVRGNVGEEARNATLVVKSGGQVIAEQKLPVLTIEPGMLTGFFAAGSKSGFWVVVLAFIALAIYVYAKAGGKLPGLPGLRVKMSKLLGISLPFETGRSAYLRRLEKIRAQLRSMRSE